MTWVSPSGARTAAPSPISSTHLRLCRTWVVLPGTAESKSRSCRPRTITDASVTLAPDIVTLLARPGRWLQVTRMLRSELTTPESQPAEPEPSRLRQHPSWPRLPSRPRQHPGRPRLASTNVFGLPPRTRPPRTQNLSALGMIWVPMALSAAAIRLRGFREPARGFHGRHDED
jgi:hypothetical protein